MRFLPLTRAAVATSFIALLAAPSAYGWGADGHRLINRIAAANLPVDVPAFLRNGAALDTLEYLGPEPDRWRNKAEGELLDEQAPDHFIDLEYADLVGPLPRKRYDFIAAVDKLIAARPDLKLSLTKIGYQPWIVEEIWQKLKVDMREYRKLLAANADTAPVQLAILYHAGWLGHYVGDGSQPLHATIQYNGWTGPNPHGYTTEHKIHSQFETVFVSANIKRTDVNALVAATKPADIADEWPQYLDYLRHTNSLVEKTYQLEKTGAFTNAGTPEGRAFTNERLAAGAIELRDLIYSAWLRSADPIEEYHGAS